MGIEVVTTLYLLRHAKSSWASATVEDHDRELQDKGRARAAALREWIEDRDLGFDLVLCSTATRARQTLDVVLPALGSPEIRYAASIYEEDATALIATLKALGDGPDRVLVVGHDPILQQTATTVAMTANGDAMDRIKSKYPTCGFAMLSFGSSGWSALAPGLGHLELFFVAADPDPS
jgi:phosphohistidine phosphatase